MQVHFLESSILVYPHLEQQVSGFEESWVSSIWSPPQLVRVKATGIPHKIPKAWYLAIAAVLGIRMLKTPKMYP